MEMALEMRGDHATIEYISFRESGDQVVVVVPTSTINTIGEYTMSKLEWTKLVQAGSLFFMKEEE